MTTASTIATLFGKLARVPLLQRGRQQKPRFLCPNCLHFGGFDFACGECWSEIPGYANGNNTQTCPRCQRSLLSADGDGVRAYCKQCKGNCDRAIYHQRQVRVVATLRPADSQSLHRAISGQEYQPQGGKGYVHDDGAWLAYVLNLSDFTDDAHSLPLTHALWEVESIWLDVWANDPKELALELGEAADRFIARAKLTEAQRQMITVCVHQAEADPVVRPVLESRFGRVRYGVMVPRFFSERAQTKAVVVEEVGHSSTVPALITALRESDSHVRRGASSALVKIGKPAMPALSEALENGDSGVRREAAEALKKIGDAAAVPALIAALKDSDESVRMWVAEALKNIGDVAAVPALIVALKDSNKNVRRYVTEALGKIGDGAAVPALIAALKDSDEDVRGKAAWALWNIGDVAAVPALITALDDSDRYFSKIADRDRHVRKMAAMALGKIGDVAAVPALIDALEDRDKYVCEEAIAALVKIGKPAVPALSEAIENSDSNVCKKALEALGKIGDNSAVPALITALKDSDKYVRREAAWTFWKIGDVAAVPALIAALMDSDEDVGRHASNALVKIGKPAVPALEAADREDHGGSSCKYCGVLRCLGAK